MAAIFPSSPPDLPRNTRNSTPDSTLPSSPPRFPSSQSQETTNGKPKKKPTVTPRTFTRFFTPRSSLDRGRKVGASRQALKDITASISNKGTGLKDEVLGQDAFNLFEGGSKGFENLPRIRKRRTLATPNTTPDRSSPLKRIRRQSITILSSDSIQCDSSYRSEQLLSDSEEDLEDVKIQLANLPKPIVRSRYRDRLGGVLRRELNSPHQTPERSRIDPDWQNETMKFHVIPEDEHTCTNVATPPPDNVLPFCTTSCNTNSLVAVGDEEGGIRLLESAVDGKPGFSKAFLTFRPHTNAILDLEFSLDDMLLATASGDQSSKIIDMPTQQAVYNLSGHVSSVKQIRFQPGSLNSVIATSSRDGAVQIWDLRCRGLNSPIQDWRTSMEPHDPAGLPVDTSNAKMIWARPVNSIYDAHVGRPVLGPAFASSDKTSVTVDNPSKTEPTARRGELSVTALSFLHPGREHLLLTGSEADATVKLWDLRMTHNLRRGRVTALSTTRQPESHNKHRQFGITSMALNGNGSRLYTLCRDNTVYAYSTSHLILGHAPEFSSASARPRRYCGQEKDGLGPLYGFRHSKFHASTFYVKLAVRPASNDKTELLAVGSSDACAVVFPTDERYTHSQYGPSTFHSISETPTSSSFTMRPPAARTKSGSAVSQFNRLNDTIPIYKHGSALIRGHCKEVTGLTWTAAGELITVGDDYTVRCWREGNGEAARDLRIGGEKNGRRWGCGWAELGNDKEWDEE